MLKFKIPPLNIISPILIFLFILFVNFYPFYYAESHAPNNLVFSKQVSWFDPWDINEYISAIKSGQTNGLFLSNLFTSTPNKPILIWPVYTIVGLTFPKQDPSTLFHILSVITVLLTVFGYFYLSGKFLKGNFEKTVATLIASLGGGFGYLVNLSKQPPDLTISSFSTLAIGEKPHLALAVILYSFALVLFFERIIQHTSSSFNKKIILVPLLLFIPAVIHPYVLLSFILISFSYLLIRKGLRFHRSMIFEYILTLLPSTLIALFMYLQFQQNNNFGGIMLGFLTQKSGVVSPISLIIGYGILTPFLIHQLFIKKGDGAFFLNLWFFLSLFLSFLPLRFSSFYFEGLFFPAGILAILSIKQIVTKIKLNYLIILGVFCLIASFSSIYLLNLKLDLVKQTDSWIYFTKDEKEALEFLDKSTNRQNAVLALLQMGNIITAQTGHPVYLGHADLTPNSSKAEDLTLSFYAQQLTDVEANEFLVQNNIKYVYWGRDEKIQTLSHLKDKRQTFLAYSFLKPVFKNQSVIIYLVTE